MQGFFNRFREFPEFHSLMDALSELHANELRVVDAESQAFGRSFDGFASSFPEALSQGLKAVQSSASEEIAVTRETCPVLVGLQSKCAALKKFQAEITQLSTLTRSREESARRSQTAPNGDSEAPAAERELTQQITKANLIAIDDMKAQFLDELASMLSDDAEARKAACAKRIPRGRSIAGALSAYRGFQDGRLEGLRARLGELEAETID
jgi:hypothetical protein